MSEFTQADVDRIVKERLAAAKTAADARIAEAMAQVDEWKGKATQYETDAKRAWLRERETHHENELDRENGEIDKLRDAHKRIQEQLQAAYRARDKVRDALSEVQAQLAELDATDGRR